MDKYLFKKLRRGRCRSEILKLNAINDSLSESDIC
jgi:hypothetical protein